MLVRLTTKLLVEQEIGLPWHFIFLSEKIKQKEKLRVINLSRKHFVFDGNFSFPKDFQRLIQLVSAPIQMVKCQGVLLVASSFCTLTWNKIPR